MIVDPDFFDHWKTQLLVDSLEDPAAPLYVLRLWAHCQNRRQSCFAFPEKALKAICRYPGDASDLMSSLIDSGFISVRDGQITVNGWDEYNAKLIANWDNGKRGGRPKNNPQETQQKPTNNPTVTHTEPIGVDKSREDKKETTNVVSSVEHGSPPDATEFIFAMQAGSYRLPKEKLSEYTATYPFDVQKELRKASQWLRDNKARRPRTGKSIVSFLTRWLNRVSDKSEKHDPGGGGKIAMDDKLKSEMERARQIRIQRATVQSA